VFYDWIEINKYSVRSSVVRTSLSFVTNTKYRWIKYMADSIRRFDSKTNRTADSVRDSIRTKKIIRRSLVLCAFVTIQYNFVAQQSCRSDIASCSTFDKSCIKLLGRNHLYSLAISCSIAELWLVTCLFTWQPLMCVTIWEHCLKVRQLH